jgi:hypothetical protein
MKRIQAQKSGSQEPLLKEAMEEGVSSGKSMQDVVVEALAQTVVIEKSKNLEEG